MIGFTDLVLLTSNLICKIKRAWNRQRILSLVFKPKIGLVTHVSLATYVL